MRRFDIRKEPFTFRSVGISTSGDGLKGKEPKRSYQCLMCKVTYELILT